MTRRLAYVWRPGGVERLDVVDDWPTHIDRDGWRYLPGLTATRTPLVYHGPLSGAEMVNYKMRRPLICEEAAAALAIFEAVHERSAIVGAPTNVTRSDRTGHSGAPRGVYRRRKSRAHA